MSKQDRQGARSVTDLERKYSFGRTFGEVFGLVEEAKKAASEASSAVKGLDEKLTSEEIFNRLTDNGAVQGIYRVEDGDIYVNASYIKGGMISADYIDTGGLMVSNLLGSYVGLYSYDKGKVGDITITDTLTGDGLEISTNKGGIKLTSAGNWWVTAQYGEFGITSSGIVCGVSPVPLSTDISIGSENYPWADIYTAHGTFSGLVDDISSLTDAVYAISLTVYDLGGSIDELSTTVADLKSRVESLEGNTTEE